MPKKKLPKKQYVTRSGRSVKSTRNDEHFAYQKPSKEKKKSNFRLDRLFPQGDVVPIFPRDDLNMQKIVSQTYGYLTPTKTMTVTPNDVSSRRQTTTPRRRFFKRIGRVLVTKNGKQSEVDFYQVPGNSQQRFEKHPPVINKSSEEVNKKLEAPDNSYKLVERRVRKNNVKKAYERKNTKRLFDNISANEMINAQTPDETLKTKYALSHLDQIGSGGEDKKENVVATTEAHNIKRLAMGESPSSQVLCNPNTNINGFYYKAKVDLRKDKEGKPTHIGGNLEVSFWASPKKTRSVQLDLDPHNKEFPTKTLHNMMKRTFNEVFSSDKKQEEPAAKRQKLR